jgi:hypothetical protein
VTMAGLCLAQIQFVLRPFSTPSHDIRNPEVEIAPSTFRGRPTGPALRATARLLSGDEELHARKVIAQRYPVFQRFLISYGHKTSRYTTMHYEVSKFETHE